MCNFLSVVTTGDGVAKFFNRDQRLAIYAKTLRAPDGNLIEKPDSHSSIAAFYGLKDDKCNKYEYLPDTNEFIVDQLNAKDDSEAIKSWVKSLPYYVIVELKNRNSGNRNSGNRNSGNGNSGNDNSGNYNSGNRNSGNRNSGNRNSGNDNSGNYNSGDYNSGNYNSGNYNSGNRNSGNGNSGDYNSGNYNSGLFNTNEPHVRLFNHQTELDRNDPRIQAVLGYGPSMTEFIYFSAMTAEEKVSNPQAVVCGGYIKKLGYKTAWKAYWGNARQETKDRFLNLPFFDAKIFEEITGINVESEFKEFEARRIVVKK